MNRLLHRSQAMIFNSAKDNGNRVFKYLPKKLQFTQNPKAFIITGRYEMLKEINNNRKLDLIPLYAYKFIRKDQLYKYKNIQMFLKLWNKRAIYQQQEKVSFDSMFTQIKRQYQKSTQQLKIFFPLYLLLTGVIMMFIAYKLQSKSEKEVASDLEKLKSNPFSMFQKSKTGEPEQLKTGVEQYFTNLQAIHIFEKMNGKFNKYEIEFEYKTGLRQKFPYIGNPNYILSYLEKNEQNSFQKTKVYFEKNQYTITKALGDAVSVLVPFIGIALSYYIFKKTSPDDIISKMSPKKTFKIQGAKDIKTKFADVAGMEQAKKEITQFVDFLKHSQKYVEMGAKIPKGALLTGPPGTGKTMLARACAGEAGVSFFYISGSEFVEMFVGLGASKVRDLFASARMEAPSIIFIDQIDAIGKKRETSRNQEKDSTLNQLLVEMDGFASNQTVIVMAATNRKDVLDSALTRPGRFDRLVQISLPEIKAREQIFMVHLKPLKVDPTKPLQQIAKRLAELTPGFSGADIANLCNQAAIIATRQKKNFIEENDFQVASQRIMAGYQKKDLANPKIKRRVAFHEAGHAVSGWFLKGGDPLVKLTIIPRSKGSLGYAQYLPKTSYIKSKDDLIDQVAILLGGTTSEQIFFGNVSSGASDDLQRVYSVTRRMVADFGFGRETYNITVDEESYVRKESEFLLKSVDQMMLEIVKEAKQRTIQILSEKKEIVTALAEELLKKETINSEDIVRIMGVRQTFD